MPDVSLTTTKTARMPISGVHPTADEIAEFMARREELGIPGGASLEVVRSQSSGVTNAAMTFTWSSTGGARVDRRA